MVRLTGECGGSDRLGSPVDPTSCRRPRAGSGTKKERGRCRAWRMLLVVGIVAGLLASSSSASAARSMAAVDEGRRTYAGTIDGAEYRVEIPERWNGTLVLYSHGYVAPHWAYEGVRVSNAPETEEWLLRNGYAVAASNYQSLIGFQVVRGQHDQVALLDWFESHVGRPRRTISVGQSMGGPIALRLAERHPDRFDGVLVLCPVLDVQGLFNSGLDVAYTIKTLLADPNEPIDLVRPRDHVASTAALQEAVEHALDTPQGRARIALAASLVNMPGWWSAFDPAPSADEQQIRDQANYIVEALIGGFAGPTARADLEPRAGGNPSSNVGIDYRWQLARSAQTDLVERAYRDAGLRLGADLDRLNSEPRIASDPQAVAFMYRTSLPTGDTPVPVATLHTTGDGDVGTDHQRWYAQQVQRHGDTHMLRQTYVERGQHCTFSAAEEVTVMQALLERIETGRWPSTNPRRLNGTADTFDPHYQQVLDLVTFRQQVMDPAFVHHRPPRPLRPSP
jgi:pimeloyl-ACP methyl ester carboxylesterase